MIRLMLVGTSTKMTHRLLILLIFVINNAFAENICEGNKSNIATQGNIENYFSENGFDVSQDVSRQFKIYFDTPEFFLLDSGYSLRFLGVEYLSKSPHKFFTSLVLQRFRPTVA